MEPNQIDSNMNINQLMEGLRNTASGLNFREGFKLLYCPYSLMNGDTRILFLSLNPGYAPSHFNKESVSDERGNSYEVELSETSSPLNRQFIELIQLLGISSDEVLTGAYVPFRTDRWSDLSKHQEKKSLEIANAFWNPLIARHPLTICCGNTVFEDVYRNLRSKGAVKKIHSGWGNASIKICNHHSNHVIGLPHLSSYRLLSNERSRRVLVKLLSDISVR